MMYKISVIIPVREINDYIREAMPYYEALNYDDYEILIFPDEPCNESFPGTRIIPSGKVGPAEKRDMALTYATGDIFAFIDDDAYPRKDWLKNAAAYFEDPEVGAVGGPAVTAANDDIWQQASGKVYESFLCSGAYTYRYLPGRKQEVDDLPSVNLLVRKSVFVEIGGYDSDYYPGEDTKLCLDIILKAKKKIIYDPDIFVWHHRRRMFRPHLKQVTNYARHRGYFAKVLPETSCRVSYFIPSLFTIGLFAGPVVSWFVPALWYVYAGVLSLYFLLLFMSIRKSGGFRLWVLTALGIISTHIGYGLYFIRGLLSNKMNR